MVTTEQVRRSPVLRPGFVDDQDAEFIGNQWDVATATLEQVVEQYYRQECKRSRTKEPESRAEYRVHSTLWPNQLIGSLRMFAEETPARSLATLTKCAVYPMAHWFIVELGVEELVSEQKELDRFGRTIDDPWLQSTLLAKINDKEAFSLSEKDTIDATIPTIGWFYNRLVRYASSLGTTHTFLLGVALEWFVTTTKDVGRDRVNIEHRYNRDARLLRLHIQERKLYFQYIRSLIEGRKLVTKNGIV